MPFTYPPAGPTYSGETETIHRLLKDPTAVQKRVRTLAGQRFIADALLTGRFTAQGGSITYAVDDDSLYTERDPEKIRPGAEYPLSPIGVGTVTTAEVVKWGQDVPVTDESIARLNLSPVERAFTKLVNQLVKKIDTTAIAAISSAVTATAAAAAAWTSASAEQIFRDVALAKAAIIDTGLGYDPDTVVVSTTAWTYALTKFQAAGYFPRESSTQPFLNGNFPVIDGMRWLVTPNVPLAHAVYVLDSTALGGMADENLGGPGYSGAMAGIETKVLRDDENDGYRLRARRVTVPVVLEPNAAYEITAVTS